MAVKKPASRTTKRVSCLVTKKSRRQQARRILPKAEMFSLTMDLDKPKRNPKKIECGYVYVLCHDRNPNYVKIGCSKDPDARLEQLKQEFSMPKLEIIHRSKKVDDVRSVEATIHRVLRERRDPLVYLAPNGEKPKKCYEWFGVNCIHAAGIVDIWAK